MIDSHWYKKSQQPNKSKMTKQLNGLFVGATISLRYLLKQLIRNGTMTLAKMQRAQITKDRCNIRPDCKLMDRQRAIFYSSL